MIYQKHIDRIDETADLVVFGGGISGVACAVSAARRGLRVVLIERGGCLGGMATAGGVHILLGGRRYDSKLDKIVRVQGGLFDEITDRMIQNGWAADPETVDLHNFNPYGWYPRMAAGVCCDIDRLKVVLDEICLNAGVEIRFFTNVIDAVPGENQKLDYVIVSAQSEIYAIRAPLYADCTGNADIAYYAGAETFKGRDEDHGVCPSTLCFFVDQVDAKEYVQYQNLHQSPKLVEIIERLKNDGKWPFNVNIFIGIKTAQEGVFLINTLRQTGVDATDSASLTKAILEGRSQSIQLLDIIREYFPGFRNARLRHISDVMGIRESRRIKGRYTITIKDALEGAHHDDCVATTTYNFDLPDPKNPSIDAMMGDVRTPNAERKHVRIEIPYRSLLPVSVNNLIVPGRALCAEREVMGACRVMGPSSGMGQAAGNAAALAMETGDYNLVDVSVLRSRLKTEGVLNLD